MTISKKQKPNQPEPGQKPSQPDDSQLTPWQKANLEYQKQNQQAANWSPTVIEGTKEKPEVEALPLDLFDEELAEPELGTRPAAEATMPFADRLPKVKYQRNNRLYRRMVLLILLLLIPLIGVVYYVSPLSKLAVVTVSGNQKVAATAIIKEAKFTTETDLWPQFFQSSTHLQQVKKAQPRVKSVSLAITKLNHFKIHVTEYQEVAVLAHDNKYSPILENGQVLTETMKNPTEKLPILENLADQKRITQVLAAYHGLSQELQEAVSQIKYEPTGSNKELLRLYMNDGNQVIVNISNMTSQMKYYSQVAKEMKEDGVIDMEVGIFSYPYGNDKKTESSTDATESSETEGNQAAAEDVPKSE